MKATADERDLRERFEAAGQEHVFAFWSGLDARARAELLADLSAVDLPLVRQLGAELRDGSGDASPRDLEPPEVFPLERDAALETRARHARQRGEADFAAGRVAFLLVAGGQGSRLGFDGPKGMFPVGPVSRWSLFELLARRLVAAERRYGHPVAWYVMTSRQNDRATRAFFEEKRCFGLAHDQVRFFEQSEIPALDAEGRIVLSRLHGVFFAPTGHGGVLAALARSGALADARGRGIERFAYFQVDNPLARPADPLFLGLHALAGAGMSSKVVAKRDAAERVGVLGRAGGRLTCVEYSDLPERLREARGPRGELVFRAGNIAVHAIERSLVEELTQAGAGLPWHVARKRVPSVDRHGRPAEIEAVKFETFVFDALRFAAASVTLEVDRRLEFSPVKNARGEDSPDTARADICRLHAGWARDAGLELPPADAAGIHPVEVDPLLADDRETFLARRRPAPAVLAEGHLYA